MLRLVLGLFVMLACIGMLTSISSCVERESGRIMTQKANIKSVRIVILKFVKTLEIKDYNVSSRIYKVKTIPGDNITYYLTTSTYVEVGDTLLTKPFIDFN